MPQLLINHQVCQIAKPANEEEYYHLKWMTINRNSPAFYSEYDAYKLIAEEGRPFYACAFYYKPQYGRLSTRAVWSHQLAYVLDFDYPNFTLEEARDMTPNWLKLCLSYHTFRSTPENERFRLVFDCVENPFHSFDYHKNYRRKIDRDIYHNKADKRALTPVKFWQGGNDR